MKKALIIVLIAIVIVIVVVVGYVARNRDKLVDLAIDKGFGTMENLVLRFKPASVSEDSVRVIFETGIEKIRAGEANASKVQAMMLYFRESMDDKQLDSLEVMKILDEIKSL